MKIREVEGDIIETTGGNNYAYAQKEIINSSEEVVSQVGAESGVKYGTNKEAPSIGGYVDLVAVLVNTQYDICHDEVENFSDYKNFWILERKGKYYHWLSTRNNKDDKNKPPALPITLASTAEFSMKATFITKTPQEIKIRVVGDKNDYVFEAQLHPKLKKEEEYEIDFVCKSLPYENTVRYFENLTLNFEYSIDGKKWELMKSVCFCLYLTIGSPGYANLSASNDVLSPNGAPYLKEDGNANIINGVNNKKCILETLLYMGCKYADNADNADEIVVKVFEYIRTLNVERARIKGAMGYWRNTSSLHAYGMFKFRGVRYLLKVGEARCGEWSDFLMDICKIQSTKLFKGKLFMLIIKPKKDENDSLMYKNCAMLVKEWRIQDPLAPEDIKQRAQDLMNIPLGLFGDHVFVLYNTNYYDPSYGVFSTKGYESSDKLLHDYTNEALSGVLSISNSPNYPLIEAIKYKPLNGVYIDPCDLNTRIPSKCQYKFKTITYNMEKELTGGFYEVF